METTKLFKTVGIIVYPITIITAIYKLVNRKKVDSITDKEEKINIKSNNKYNLISLIFPLMLLIYYYLKKEQD